MSSDVISLKINCDAGPLIQLIRFLRKTLQNYPTLQPLVKKIVDNIIIEVDTLQSKTDELTLILRYNFNFCESQIEKIKAVDEEST